MAWWTKVGDKIEKHGKRQPKLAAMIRLNFARNMEGVPLEQLGLYRRDPGLHPGEPNLLPEMVEKTRQKDLAQQIRKVLKGGRTKRPTRTPPSTLKTGS